MQIAKLPILALIITMTCNITITPLTTQPIVDFSSLSQTIITTNAQFVYTIQNNPKNNATTINYYSITGGSLHLNASNTIEYQTHQNWQLILVEQQLLIFPLEVNKNIIILDQTRLDPIKTVLNQWNFLNIISSPLYNIRFLSTSHGQIYYSHSKDEYGTFSMLPASKHLGNTYLSLSPNNLYLCSTDQFTGILTVWSVTTLQKLYEYQTMQNGIRAHSWDLNSKLIYAFGYESGQLYILKVENSIQLQKKLASNLTSLTSCFYHYQTNQIVAFSYNLSAVVSYSVGNNSFQVLVVYPDAQKIQFQSNLKYFSVANTTTASYYSVSSLCASNEYMDITIYQCITCGSFCRSCRPQLCFVCLEGYILTSDSFNCAKQKNVPTPTSKNTTTKYIQISIWQLSSTSVLNGTLDFINKTFSIPGHRQFLNLFFELFSSFDHLMLFIYHNRTYGPNMKFYLQLIHSTIDYRFNIISNEVCKNYLGIDFNQWKQNIDFKSNFSLPTFVGIEQNGQGLIVNNLQYFFLNIPLILVAFCLSKCLFHLFFNFSISLFFRKFQFIGILVIMLIQGNVQLFFFAMAGDYLTLFSPNFMFKLYTAATVFTGWLLFCLSTVGLFSLYWLYKKYAKFLLQNCRGSVGGSFYFLTTNGLMNVLRGLIHRIMIREPQQQAIVLMILELNQILIHIYCVRRVVIIESNFLLSLFMVSNISRVIFTFSLLFQSQSRISVLDQIHTFVIFTAIVLVFLGVVYGMNEAIRQVRKMLLVQLQIFRTRGKIAVQQTVIQQFDAQEIKKKQGGYQKRKDVEVQPLQGNGRAQKRVKFNFNQISRQRNPVRTSVQLRNNNTPKSTTKIKKERLLDASRKYLNIKFTTRKLPY